MSAKVDYPKLFFHSILRAAETEPRGPTIVRGATGLPHPVYSVGVDEVRRRLLIVSKERDARSAALVHADIQAAVAPVRVLLARVVGTSVAEAIQSLAGGPDWRKQLFSSVAEQRSRSDLAILGFKAYDAGGITENLITDFFLNVEMRGSSTGAPAQSFILLYGPGAKFHKSQTAQEQFNIARQLAEDETALDRQLGICPLPLYRFSPEEIELFHQGKDLEAMRNLLRREHVLQYFFPPPDHVALGLIERSSLAAAEVNEHLAQPPELGHPFGEPELTPADVSLAKVVDALQDRGLAVEGEMGMELTPEGKSVRATVRFKPREGFISKLLNRISVSLDLKDLFRYWKP